MNGNELSLRSDLELMLRRHDVSVAALTPAELPDVLQRFALVTRGAAVLRRLDLSVVEPAVLICEVLN